MADRATGPTGRSEEVRLEVWYKLVEACGRIPNQNAGILTWIAGARFVLREVDLSSLTLDSKCVELNLVDKLVILRLPVSKTDAAGRGAAQALGCSCGSSRGPGCPFHVFWEVVQEQCRQLGISDRSLIPEGQLPLIGQRCAPDFFVDKKVLIEEAQRHLGTYAEKYKDASIDLKAVTGHFTSGSGTKDMARRGCSFPTIQWYARHSSQTTWDYVEDAWGEAPERVLKLKNEMELVEKVATTLQRVTL